MDNTFLSDAQVAARYAVARSAIWRWCRDYDFPKPVKLSPGCTRWRMADVLAYEEKREKSGRAAR